MSQKRRNWCFTNNQPENNKNYESEHARYIVWQLEKGENGTFHHQGYIEFNKPVTLPYLKQEYGKHIHWEGRKGTPEQAREYCMKQDSRQEGPWEFGTFKGKQGKRTDLDTIKEKLDEGYDGTEIAQEHFSSWVKYNKSFDRYIQENRKQEHRDKPEVIVLWGPPGTGKTRTADKYDEDAYWKMSGKWWDGYTGQETIILDDFYGWIDYDLFLRITDRYPCSVEIKGGTVNLMNRKKIIITSNKKPEEWYPQHDFGAINRRLDKVHYCGTGTEVPGNTMPALTSSSFNDDQKKWIIDAKRSLDLWN